MKFKRTGDDVDVTGHGTVEHGETVDFDPSFTEGLTGQDGWEHVVDRKRSKAAKKAAASTPEPEPAGEVSGDDEGSTDA